MTPHPTQSGAEPESPDFEELLAQCIDALSSGGPPALDVLLARHASQATALRDRLATLERLGMLAPDGEDVSKLPPIGPYVLVRSLGTGGMSRVYLARHQSTGELAALKVLNTPLAADPRARLRFEREILAVSSLSHPLIVAVRESGVSEDRPWLAMRYVEGATLDVILDELRARAVPFDELTGQHIHSIALRDSELRPGAEHKRGHVESVCRILLDICAALEHAHEFGIVHRDVKPANILIATDGRARLLDLGLASLDGSPSLTRTGDFAGTPYYVAPEQAKSVHAADQRSDVFSLGVTMYEALTLRRPFEGGDAAEVFRNLQACDPLPPRRHNAYLPRDLETICMCALEKDPALRYASMGEFAADLQRFLEFKPVVAKPIGVARRALRLAKRHASLSILLAVLVVFMIGTPIALAFVNKAIRAERDVAQANADEAARQARISELVVDHLVELFSPSTAYAENSAEWGWEEMLAASVARIPSEIQEDPLLRAALLEAAGRIHSNLNRFEVAVPLLDRAHALRQRQPDASRPRLASTFVWLARAHLASGNAQAARTLATRGLEALEGEVVSPLDSPAFELRLCRAQAAMECDDSASARQELLKLEQQCLEQPGEVSTRLECVDAALATLFLRTGEFASALTHCDRALDRLRRAWIPDVSSIASKLLMRASIQDALNQPAAAVASRLEADELSNVFRRALSGLSGDEWLANFPFEAQFSWVPEFERAFQAGITALQTSQAQDAIAAFAICLRLAPVNPVCHYNMACAHAIAGDGESAMASLAKAQEHRFGLLQGNLKALERDPDLALVSGDPRFIALRADLAEKHVAAHKRHASPRTFAPKGTNKHTAAPLVVVLAGDRVREKTDRFEAWSAIAESANARLVYVEGLLVGEDSSWIAEIDNFLDGPVAAERVPVEWVARFAEEHSIEAGRVLLVGEGSGAPVAFDMALRAPGFFSATLLLDGVPLPSTEGEVLSVARACGSNFYLMLGEEQRVLGPMGERSPQELVAGMCAWMRDGGLTAAGEVVPKLAREMEAQRMTDVVRAILNSESPPLHSAPK